MIQKHPFEPIARRIYRPKDPGYGRVLPHRLSDARVHAGLEQAELARRIDIPASSISHFEAGRRKPSLNSLYKLAEALAVSTDYLLGRTSDRAAHLDREHFLRLGDMDKNEREIMLEIAKVLSTRARK